MINSYFNRDYHSSNFTYFPNNCVNNLNFFNYLISNFNVYLINIDDFNLNYYYDYFIYSFFLKIFLYDAIFSQIYRAF